MTRKTAAVTRRQERAVRRMRWDNRRVPASKQYDFHHAAGEPMGPYAVDKENHRSEAMQERTLKKNNQ